MGYSPDGRDSSHLQGDPPNRYFSGELWGPVAREKARVVFEWKRRRREQREERVEGLLSLDLSLRHSRGQENKRRAGFCFAFNDSCFCALGSQP